MKAWYRKSELEDAPMIAGLLLLSTVPIVAGVARMGQLINGQVMQENFRFHSSPTPFVMHIVAATIYSFLGAFQFSKRFRISFPRLHRKMGKVLIASGSLVALSGLWMTLIYPAVNFDGPVVFWARLIVGTTMMMFLILGVEAIRRRKFIEHGNWMVRAYALGLGAGTQVLTHIPWFLWPNIQGELARSVFMILGWVINIIFAEWVIRRSMLKFDFCRL